MRDELHSLDPASLSNGTLLSRSHFFWHDRSEQEPKKLASFHMLHPGYRILLLYYTPFSRALEAHRRMALTSWYDGLSSRYRAAAREHMHAKRVEDISASHATSEAVMP